MNYGCQFVFMNYQLYDKNMETYYNSFKTNKNFFILKKDNLRYIDQPPPKLDIQNKDLSYQPKTITQKGWFKFNM